MLWFKHSVFVGKFGFSVFQKGELDTFSWEEGDDWLLAFSNNEDVVSSCGEGVSSGVLNVSNIETTWMFLNVLEDTNSTNIVSSNGQDWSSIFELNASVNFSCFKI